MCVLRVGDCSCAVDKTKTGVCGWCYYLVCCTLWVLMECGYTANVEVWHGVWEAECVWS